MNIAPSAPEGATPTRTERKLYEAAEHWLPGSGMPCVTVYRCAKTLRMAATLSSFLQDTDSERRLSTMLDMREQVNGFQSTRPGPKDDRHTAAHEALDALQALAEGSGS